MPSRKSRSSGKSKKSSVPSIPPSTCTICFTDTSEKLLTCDRCAMNVHATCYEMDVKGIFRCVPCIKGATMKPPPSCAICDESLPAVYLPTTKAGEFAHLFCCEWVPATSVGSDHRTIEDIDQIDPDYRRLTCIVCKKKGGTTLQCAYGRCVRAFHPLCGQLGGMKLVDETPQGPLKTIKCYCDKHIDKASEAPKPKQKKSTSKKQDTVTSTPATTSSSLAPSSTAASDLSPTPSDISTSIDYTPIDHDIFELTHSLSQESHKYTHVEDEMSLLDDRKEGETLEERAARIAVAKKKEKEKEKQKKEAEEKERLAEKERERELKRQREKEEEEAEEAERKRLKKEQKRAKKEAEEKEKERQEAEKAEKQKQKEKEKEVARQKQIEKEKKEQEAREKEEARQKQLEKEKKEKVKEKKEKEAREKEEAARTAAKTKPVVTASPAKKVIDLEADASDEEDMWEDESRPTTTKPSAAGTASATTTSATTSKPTTTSISTATTSASTSTSTKPSAPVVGLDSDDSDDEEFNRAIASARKVPPKKPAHVSKSVPASKKNVEEEEQQQEQEQQEEDQEEEEEEPVPQPKHIKKGRAIKRKRTEIEEEEEEEEEEAPKKKGRPKKHATTSEEVQDEQDVDMESKHDHPPQDTKTPDQQPSMDETDWEVLDYGRGEVEDPNDDRPQWNGDKDVCAVCFTPWPYEDDEIVQCDDCNVMVHQSCYGIWPLPPEDDPWYCSPCQWKRDNPDRVSDDDDMMLCAICGHGNVNEMPAAFKPCITKRRKHVEHGWAHLFCGMWTPETQVQNIEEGMMEPIVGLEKIHPDRRKMMCMICKRVTGAVIQCEQIKCLWSYHPLCGKLAKLYFKDLSVGEDADANVRVTYCKTHDPRNPRLTKEEAEKKKAEEEDHRTLLVMAANSDVSHRQYTLPKRLTEAKLKAQMDANATRKRKSDSNIPTLKVLRRQARNAAKSVPGQKAPRISKAARDMFSNINKTEILRAIHGNSNAFSDDKTDDMDAIDATRAAREELQRARQTHIIPVKKRLYRREEEEKEEKEEKKQEKKIETVELEESDSEAENEERERQAKQAAASTSTGSSTAPTSFPAPAPTPTFIPTPGLHIDALDPKVFNDKDIRSRRMVRLAFQHVVEQKRGEEIEQTIYNKFGLGPDFLSKARHLAENLNLAGNAQLRARVRAGEIPVSDLVSMSFQELSKYNTELTQQRAADHDEMMKETVIPSEQETTEKLKQVALLQKTMITR